MVKKKSGKKENEGSNTSLKNMAFVSVVVLMLYLLPVILICLIMFLTDIPGEFQYYMALTVLSLSSILTGFFAGKKNKMNGMMYGALYSLIPTLLITIISFLLNSFSFDYRIILTPVLMIGAAAVGGIVAVNSRKKRR